MNPPLKRRKAPTRGRCRVHDRGWASACPEEPVTSSSGRDRASIRYSLTAASCGRMARCVWSASLTGRLKSRQQRRKVRLRGLRPTHRCGSPVFHAAAWPERLTAAGKARSPPPRTASAGAARVEAFNVVRSRVVQRVGSAESVQHHRIVILRRRRPHLPPHRRGAPTKDLLSARSNSARRAETAPGTCPVRG